MRLPIIAAALSLALLAGCGTPADGPTLTPAATATPTPEPSLPLVTATPAPVDPLQEGVDRFLDGLETAQPGTLVFEQSLGIAEFMVDIYKLAYVPYEGAEESTAYLLYGVGADGQSEPWYTGHAAAGERVEQVGLEQAATEALYQIFNLEFSFPRVNFFGYFGLGGGDFVGYDPTWLDADDAETVRMQDYDVWWPDDYWYETRYDGLTLLCYHGAEADANAIYKIETTRDDLLTYRGARVGMTKAEILDLYPEIDPDLDLWDWDNYLEYGDGKALGPVGSHIFFFFDSGDILTKITMEHVYID